MARQTKAEKLAYAQRMEAIHADARRVVESGKCPQCGSGIRRNLALSGWYVCEQKGDGHFRKDQSKPSCSFQCFTV